MKISRHSRYLILILIFAILLRMVFFTGSDHSDSLLYYTYANDILKGNFQLTPNHFSSRIGIIYPQAFVYYLFGINELTSSILPLVVSIGSIILAFYFGKMLFNAKTGLIASLLLAVYPLDVVYATRLIPDFPAALFMALSAFFFLNAEKLKSKLYYFLAGISWGIAYLIKEVSVLMALFFILYAVYKKRFKKEYLLILAGLIPLLLTEFSHSYILAGNPFFRYSQVQSGEAIYVIETYSNYFGFGMLSRLFLHWPYLMLTDVHYGLFFIFIFIAIYYFLRHRNENVDILLLWAAPLFLYLNFGTVSLEKYVPLPVVVKFLAIISMPSLLILAFFLGQKEKFIRKLLFPITIIILFFSSIGFVYISNDRAALKEIKEAYPFIRAQDKIIYTDERTLMILNYLSGFESNDKLKPFNKFDLLAENKNVIVDLKDKHNILVLVNKWMIDGLPKVYKDIKFPEQVANIPKNWQIADEFGSGDKKITVYYMP